MAAHPGTRRVALVIGAAGGIGAATGEALAREGWLICMAEPAAERCDAVAERIRAAGGTAAAYVCDATDAGAVAALAAAIGKQHGAPAAVINCAGLLGPVAHVADCDPERWRRCLEVNLLGPFNVCRAFLPLLREAGGGVVVHMSSGAAFAALEGWSAYCCSKAALATLSRIAAAEYPEVSIYSFQPGMVNTDMGRESMRVDINRATKFDPSTFEPPGVPARAIAWLCRERPADLVGKEIVLTDPELRRRVGLGEGRPPAVRRSS